jgi:pyruvate/2-oxoglutarate dehydrogenase complex dihydrolipoamide dehydrogenase (E3) component
MAEEFDLIVIGGGSAGVTAAMKAVKSGARVALIERSGRFGGTCRYVGCVPSKTLLHTARVLHQQRNHAAALGLPANDPAWDWRRVQQHKNKIIRRVGGDDGYGPPSEFGEAGGHTFEGEARFRSRTEIAIGDTTLRTRNTIIATGSRPQLPPIDGLERVPYLTWETIFDVPAIPPSLAIIGGGPLAIEFAQMFGRFGSRVTVLEATDQIMPQADADAARLLCDLLGNEGVEIRTSIKITAARRDGDDCVLEIDGGSEKLSFTHLLIAAGIQPNTDNLDLDRAGVQVTDKDSIKVDEQLRTTAEGIWAVGDVATKHPFTHIAAYEAGIAVENAIQQAGKPVDERVVPWAVYTDPSLAHVGMTEKEAREQGIAIVTATIEVGDVERSLLAEQQAGMIKLVARREGGELLGADIVSQRADDMIHEAALAMQQRLPVRAIAATIHAYPTWSQGLQQAAATLAEQIS